MTPFFILPLERRDPCRKDYTTTMLKALEVLAQSDKSWEDAAQNPVDQAARSVRGTKSIYIKEMEASVEDGKINQYRINAKIPFTLEGA